jgi:hypothetical protein
MNFGTGALCALVGPMLHAVAVTQLKIMFVITVVNQTSLERYIPSRNTQSFLMRSLQCSF